MRYGCAFVVLACLVAVHALVPADVSAQGATQASITGAGSRQLRGRAAGRDRRGVEPGADRKGAHGGHRRHGPLPHREPAARHLRRHLHADRVQRRATGRHRAGGVVRRDGQRGPEGGLARRKRSPSPGEAPVVDVQSAQRQQVVKADVLASIPASRSYEQLAALVPGIQLNTNAQNVGGINGPAPPFFGGHGGAGTEGRLNMDGIGTGGATGGVSLLIVDTGNAAEITISTTGGLGRRGNRRPDHQRRAALGRQPLLGPVLRVGRRPGHAERQLHAVVERRGPAVAVGAGEGVGRQPRGRRTDQERQAVVLRDDAESGQLRDDFQHLLQQERRRSQCLDLCARPQPPVGERPWWKSTSLRTTWQIVPAQQDRGVLGRAVLVPAVQRRRQSDDVAGGHRAERHPLDAGLSGGVELADLEPRPARGGLLGHGLQLRPRKSRGTTAT